MTRFAPLWQQQGTYPASVDRGLMGALWPTGGASGPAPAKVAGTMTVNIPAGSCAVPLQTGESSALCRWDATEVATIAAAPPSGQSRIDLIVAQVRDALLDGGANNDFVFAVVAGAPTATNPAVPAVPTNAYAMAQVLVPGGVANLDTATLTDVRAIGLAAGGGPRDRYHAQYWRAAAYTFTTGAFAPLAMDTRLADPANLYNPTTGFFVVPQTGVWQIAGFLSGTVTAAQWIQAALVVTGGASIAANAVISGGGGTLGVPVFYAGRLNAGDNVSLQRASSVLLNGVAMRQWTNLSIDYLGTG